MKNIEFLEKAQAINARCKDERLKLILGNIVAVWFDNNNDLPEEISLKNISIPNDKIPEIIQMLTEVDYFNEKRPAESYEVFFKAANIECVDGAIKYCGINTIIRPKLVA